MPSNNPRYIRLLLWSSLLFLTFYSSVASAAVTWDGGAATTSWTDAANWSTNAVPTSTDDVDIPASSGLVDASNLSVTVNSLFIGSGSTLKIANVGSAISLTAVNGVTNNGTIQINSVSTGGATLISSGTITNTASGMITDSGTSITENYINGNVVNQGTITINKGMSFNKAGGVHTNSGLITLVGGASPPTLNTSNGTLTNTSTGSIVGSGTINAGSGGLTNHGTMRPGGAGAIGQLQLFGSFSQAADGVLEIEMQGATTPGTDYDQMLFSSQTVTYTLGGQLKVILLNSFTPVNGNSFLVANLSIWDYTGTFTTYDYPPLSGSMWSPVYNTTGVTLNVSSSTVTWTATAGDGLWNTGLNWSTGTPPTAQNDVVIDDTCIGCTVTLNVDATVSSLTVSGSLSTQTLLMSGNTLTLNNTSSIGVNGVLNQSGGTITGPGSLTVNGAYNWTGGTITGTGALVTTGTTTVSSSGTKYLTGRTWTQSGVATFSSSGWIYINGGGVLNNTAAGVINLNTLDATPITYTGTGTATFNNAGTLNQQATGSHAINNLVAFTNTGTVNVQAGTLTRAGDFTNSGTLSIASAAMLNLTGGTTNLDPGTVLTGTGTLQVAAATLSSNTALSFTASTPVLALASGTLTGAGDLNIENAFNWTGGTITGTGALVTTGTTTVSSSGTKYLTGRTWTQSGVATFSSSGWIYINGGGVLNNTAAGVINLNTLDATPINYTGTGTATFNNAGTLNQQATGTHSINSNIVFINTGTITAEPGILSVGTLTTSVTNISIGGVTAGTEYGRISASGVATLNGTLNVNLINSYMPASGATYTIVSAGAASGVFSAVNLPPLTGGKFWNAVSYNPTSVVLSVYQAYQPLTVAVNGLGTVISSDNAIDCGITCNAAEPQDSVITLMAAPDPGSSFVSWTGCDSSISSLCTVTMNGAKNVSAQFQSSGNTLAGLLSIATTTGLEGAFGVSFDGTNYLVGIGGDVNAASNETAQFVDQTGSLVGPLIQLGSTGGAPLTAFDGTRHLAVWQDDTNYPTEELRGQFVNPDGSLWNSVVVSAGTGSVVDIGGIVYGNGVYLVVYKKDPGEVIYGNLVSASTGTAGAEFPISSGPGRYFLKNVAFDGTNFFAVWGDATTNAEVRGRFIGADGSLLGSELVIKSGANAIDWTAAVGYFNGMYLVAWTEYTGSNFDLMGQLVSASTQSMSGPAIAISDAPGMQFFPGIANNGTDFLVTWSDLRNDANGNMVCDPGEGTCMDIYSRSVSTAGALAGPEFAVSTAAGDQLGAFSDSPVNGKLFGLVNSSVNFGAPDMRDNVYGAIITFGVPDTTPPTVSLVTPPPGAANVPATPFITAEFSEDMDAFTINSTTFTLSGGITGTVAYDAGSKSASFTPSSNLAFSTVYTATIVAGASGVTDLAGNAMATNYVWNFTTVSAPTNTITASTGTGGSIDPSGSVLANYGSDQTFAITPTTGYHISNVLVDGVSQGLVSTYTFTYVTAPHTIGVTFGIDTMLITTTTGTGGSISPSGAVGVDYGSSQSFSVTPTTGYHTTDVLVDSVSQGVVSAYTFTNVTTDHTIDAAFEINTYSITASATTGGTVSPSGTAFVNHGSSQSFTITPLAGYYVADVLVDGRSVGAVLSYSFSSVAANHTISAAFAAATAPPSFISTSPAADSVISNSRVGYTLDKDVASGTVTFTWTGGTTDLVSARTYTFTETTAGSHTADTGLALLNGAVYSVTFQATDSQGSSVSVTNDNITYDGTIPSVAITGPVPNSRVNTSRVSYSLSETVTSGQITIARAGGTGDGLSPYTYTLTGSELAAGSHTLDTGKALVNGAIYSFTIGNMVDAAGNAAAPASSTNVEFDNQSVVITVISPSTKEIISSATATYSLSEEAQSGAITFTRAAGSQDSASPHVYTMQTADLAQGPHTVSTGITLVDGAFYTVSFTATDLVANPATSVSNARVYYAPGYDPVHPWNVDNSGTPNSIDEADVQKVFHAFGSRPGDTYWNPVCDLDKNNMVDGKDMMILQQHYGETW